MKISHIIFDWNGTILDDIESILHATNQVLAALNRSPINTDEYRDAYFMPVSKIYERFGVQTEELERNSLQYAEIFHNAYEPLAAHAPTRKDATQTLQLLEDMGLHMVILSNHTVEGIYMQLERLGLTEHFDAVSANDTLDGSHFKGKKDRLEEYLRIHDINARTAIIIGDTIEEVEIGKELGLHTVAITGGYHTEDRLRATHPEFIIKELNELPEVMRKLEEGDGCG